MPAKKQRANVTRGKRGGKRSRGAGASANNSKKKKRGY